MRSGAFEWRLTPGRLKHGSVYVPEDARRFFPQVKRPVKISVLFDDGEREARLNFNPGRSYVSGVSTWYKARRARPGNIVTIEVLEPFKRFRFALKKDVEGEPEVGPPINFRGLVYAPVNEQGVIFLFGKVINDLNIVLEAIRSGFPDAICRRLEGKRWVRRRVEFEYRSSDFERHEHRVNGCDMVVCWEHDWAQCPLEVIELKSLIKRLLGG